MRTSSLFPVLAAWALLCACESPKAEKAERERAKMLDDFYEMAWIECVNELGLDRCRVIQETGFQQCHNYRTAGGTERPRECIERRMDDRLETLVPRHTGDAEEEGERGAPPVRKELPAEAPEQPPKTETF